jgi:hypothetical protein
MPAEPVSGPRSLDLVFGLLLASGVSVGALFVLWTADPYFGPRDSEIGNLVEITIVGVLSFVVTILAWFASGLRAFMPPIVRDVRVGAALATSHLGCWLGVALLARWLPDGPAIARVASIAVWELGVYGVGMTYLAARWFWRRRRPDPGQVAA